MRRLAWIAPLALSVAIGSSAVGADVPGGVAPARTYLGALVPHRLDEYRWFEAQIATGEFLRGEALPSDISASAFIGDLVGRYVLVTRGYAKP